jgi:hypothetical protein
MKAFLLTLACALLASPAARAQSLQTIQPGDSLETRRAKDNSNFSYLNTRFSSLNMLAHSHDNKIVLDKIPSTLGLANQVLGMNAAANGFEHKSIVAGSGITVSHSANTITISLNAGAGITSLNGLTPGTQTFGNDTNVTIVSSGSQHTITWSGLLPSSRGGTNNAFFQVTGPASTLKTFTFPNQSATVLTDAAPVTQPQGGTGTSSPLTGLIRGNGASAFSAVAAPSGAVVGDSDSQTLSSKVLASPQITTLADLRAQAEARFSDADNSNYVGLKAPAVVGANKVYLMPATVGTANQMWALIDPTTGETGWATPPGASGGEANTASNLGTGLGWFKQKSGVDLQLKSLVFGSNKLSGTSNTNDLTVDVVEANLSRANMTGTTPVNGGGTGATSLSGVVVGNGTSPFTTVAAPSGAIVGTTDTQTLDHKTFDVEAAGNVITTVSKIWIDAAGGDGSTGFSNWDLPSSNAPTAAIVTGTNVIKGVLDFADGSLDLSAQRAIMLPSDWTGAIDVKFTWFSSATSGNVVLGIATGCAGDGALDDPSFNGFSDVTDIAKGTANQLNDATITGINTTGCSAGKLWHFKIARRLSQSADSMAGTLRLVGVEITLRRAQ